MDLTLARLYVKVERLEAHAQSEARGYRRRRQYRSAHVSDGRASAFAAVRLELQRELAADPYSIRNEVRLADRRELEGFAPNGMAWSDYFRHGTRNPETERDPSAGEEAVCPECERSDDCSCDHGVAR